MSSKNADKLSILPEEILSYILSLMPTKYAIQTSILSKRWRYTWMLVTNLDFEDILTMDSFHSLTKIVDRVLKFCTPSQVKLFRLHLRVNCSLEASVSYWIYKVVRLNIRDLDLEAHLFQLPLSMFTCKTLTTLILIQSPHDRNDDWEIHFPVNLPCLKTLDITGYANLVPSAFKLINGCSVLESLSLKVTFSGGLEDYLFNIPTLKRLRIIFICHEFHKNMNKVVLNVPNLEYIFFDGTLCSLFVMEDVSSLVEASFKFFRIFFYFLWVELLNGLSGVKSLSLQNISSLMEFRSPISLRLPIFPNMTHLELKWLWHTRLIPQFLERAPELKHLFIEKLADPFRKEPEEYSWVDPKLVPVCMLTNLTTIKFTMGVHWKCFVPLMEYVLGNAEVLKTVTIVCEYLRIEEEDKRLRAEFFKLLPRVSRHSEIHFHGNWSHSTIMQ
ncbi:hypothetical protein M8C21_019359 [Ambrosia artemisiifolia]|uniref:F-box domain-containing protein n=1 Tax=Ambrosia artemisiifolia TaxID=4212 RepID=A0AAD5CH62_AMBAR|nr:hypothetical protein M8C21_019359 [Ambrosia artemisiifolia]